MIIALPFDALVRVISARSRIGPMSTTTMSTRQHSREAYLLAFHTLYCLKKSPIEAGRAAGIHPAVIERAATGYMNSNEGRVGRAVFLEWAKGLRDGEHGVPCCGGHLLAGDRPLPVADPFAAKIAELEKELAELKRVSSGVSNPVPQVSGDSHATG